MSRRVYLLGVGLVLVALGLVLTDALLWQPEASKANLRRIRPGMTLREVEAILGGPADRTYDIKRFPPHMREMYYRPGEKWTRGWAGTHGEAIVNFDEGDRVTSTCWDEVEDTDPDNPPSPLAKLRAWLDW
jgi:hypothetical protein